MIDRQKIANFRTDFTEAVKDLEKKYGVVIELGHIQFSAESFTGKLTVSEGDSQYDVNKKEFERICRLYDLDKEDFDRRFTWKAKEYIIVGIRPSKRKYPIACRCLDDNVTYGFPQDLLLKILNK